MTRPSLDEEKAVQGEGRLLRDKAGMGRGLLDLWPTCPLGMRLSRKHVSKRRILARPMPNGAHGSPKWTKTAEAAQPALPPGGRGHRESALSNERGVVPHVG